MSLERLPSDTIYEVILKLPIEDALHLCQVNQKFREICSQQRLWELLFAREFPQLYSKRKGKISDWKKDLQTEYNALLQFKNQYPILYQFKDDPSVKGLFENGWEYALDKWNNAPATYRNSDDLWKVFQIVKQAAPDALFFNPQHQKTTNIPYIYNRQAYFYLPSSSVGVVQGIVSYFDNSGRQAAFLTRNSDGKPIVRVPILSS